MAVEFNDNCRGLVGLLSGLFWTSPSNSDPWGGAANDFELVKEDEIVIDFSAT